jgi:hypothetical protein
LLSWLETTFAQSLIEWSLPKLDLKSKMVANTGLNFFQSIDYDTIGKLIATCSLTKSCGGDRMVVGFTTTYAIGVYHH